MPSIELKNITFEYRSKKQNIRVLQDFSCKFEPNKINVIIGPSGGGKTTLLGLLTGTLDVGEGQIFFDDVDVSRYSIRERNVSLVNQNIVLYPHLSIFKNIATPLSFTEASAEEIKQRVFDLAKLLNIEVLLSRKPREISIGQAQRVAIARAIIKKPDVYLFDEPFSNLDEETTNEIIYEIKKIFDKLSATVIFVTHSLKEALAFGDCVFVISDGKLVEQINAKDLLNSKNEITQELIRNEFNKVL